MINVAKIRSAVPELLRSRLNKKLTYHSANHTIDVVHTALEIARNERIRDSESLEILEIAAWFHDTGFIKTYNNHEQESCQIAETYLESLGANPQQIQAVQSLILATRIPQQPHNKLAEIICDADLDYIGRPEFEKIAEQLHQEWIAYGLLKPDDDFDEIQINFLSSHHYFTTYNKNTRNPLKQLHLQKLIESRKVG